MVRRRAGPCRGRRRADDQRRRLPAALAKYVPDEAERRLAGAAPPLPARLRRAPAGGRERAVRGAGGRSSSGSPCAARRSSCSRTSSGPTRASSSSSTTCSNGRSATRSSSSRSPGPSSWSAAPTGAPAGATSSPSPLGRSPERRCARCSAGLVPGLPDTPSRAILATGGRGPAVCRRDHPDAPRGRPAGGAGRDLPADRATSGRSTSRTRCTRSSRPAWMRLDPADRALLQDGAVLGQIVQRSRP